MSDLVSDLEALACVVEEGELRAFKKAAATIRDAARQIRVASDEHGPEGE